MKFRNIFAVALAGLAFTACSNDDVPNTGPENGEKAYVGLNLTLPAGSFSRAADATADATETKVTSVSVYGQAQSPGAPIRKLTLSKDLTESDFTVGTNTYTLKEGSAIKVTGKVDSKMNIFVVLNNTSDLSPNLHGVSGTPTAFGADIKSTAKANEFLMSNAAMTEATLKATAAEAVAQGTIADVEVERAVAKILVKASTVGTLDLTNDFEDTGKTGKFQGSTIRWAVGNSPKSLYVRKYNDGGIIKTPNYTYNSGDSYTQYSAAYDVLADATGVVTATPDIEIMPSTSTSTTGFDGGKGYVGYSNENIHDTYVNGNTTNVLIAAAFIPSTTYANLTGIGNSMTGTDANVTAPATFYYHNPSGKYVTEAAYTAYIAANTSEAGSFVGPYKDGKCYYQIPVWDITSDDTKAKGTERNTFYTLSVKSLSAPGKPTVPDVDAPVEDPDAFIGVDITIAPWNAASMGNDVELQ